MEDKDNNLKVLNLNHVQSKYILKKLYDNVPNIKFLNIIRYNKTIQNRLDIDINIYKNEYSKIIFEITVIIPPKKEIREEIFYRPRFHYFEDDDDDYDDELRINDIDDYLFNPSESSESPEPKYRVIGYESQKSDFIKIENKYKPYFHFYFDNDEREKKVNFVTSEDNISKIKVIVDYEVKALNKLFYTCSSVYKINFTKFSRNNIKDMSYMFHC